MNKTQAQNLTSELIKLYEITAKALKTDLERNFHIQIKSDHAAYDLCDSLFEYFDFCFKVLEDNQEYTSVEEQVRSTREEIEEFISEIHDQQIEFDAEFFREAIDQQFLKVTSIMYDLA